MKDLKLFDSYNLLTLGIESILAAWPLLRGVVDTKFNEFEHKKIRDLKDYLSDINIEFDKVSNQEIEMIFVSELCYMLNNYEMNEFEIQNYLLIFMDEIFDSIPHPSDNHHILISKKIFEVKKEALDKNYSFFDKLKIDCENIKNKFNIKKEEKKVEKKVESDKNDSEEEIELEKLKNKKKKKNNKIELDFTELNQNLKNNTDFSSNEEN